MSYCINVDTPERATLTVRIGKDHARHAVRVKDEAGVTWYGTVDNDGVALLTRSDLLPRRD